jgi:hypothetical protein
LPLDTKRDRRLVQTLGGHKERWHVCFLDGRSDDNVYGDCVMHSIGWIGKGRERALRLVLLGLDASGVVYFPLRILWVASCLDYRRVRCRVTDAAWHGLECAWLAGSLDSLLQQHHSWQPEATKEGEKWEGTRNVSSSSAAFFGDLGTKKSELV